MLPFKSTASTLKVAAPRIGQLGFVAQRAVQNSADFISVNCGGELGSQCDLVLAFLPYVSLSSNVQTDYTPLPWTGQTALSRSNALRWNEGQTLCANPRRGAPAKAQKASADRFCPTSVSSAHFSGLSDSNLSHWSPTFSHH